MKTGAELITEERGRQINIFKFTKERDSKHTENELIIAAQCYLEELQTRGDALPNKSLPKNWPKKEGWDIRQWYPTKDNIRQLAKAGALIAAEIDRIQCAKEITVWCQECLKKEKTTAENINCPICKEPRDILPDDYPPGYNPED